MRALVQRSGKSSVTVEGKTIGKINNGLVVLVGFTEGDDLEKIQYIVKKIVNLRIFDDENGVMNKSILDYGGDVLSISQFTLYANTKEGRRPSFVEALRPHEAEILYDYFNQQLAALSGLEIQTGVFGADMDVYSVNDGPFTLVLDSKELF